MTSTRLLALAIAVAAGSQPTISGQQMIALENALRWRSIGPYRGGRVTAVAGIASQPLVYYMGATWDKAPDFHDRASWETYVRDQKLDFDPAR